MGAGHGWSECHGRWAAGCPPDTGLSSLHSHTGTPDWATAYPGDAAPSEPASGWSDLMVRCWDEVRPRRACEITCVRSRVCIC